jgi:hypothetical protein
MSHNSEVDIDYESLPIGAGQYFLLSFLLSMFPFLLPVLSPPWIWRVGSFVKGHYNEGPSQWNIQRRTGFYLYWGERSVPPPHCLR